MKLTEILKEIKITGKKPNEFLKVFLDMAAKKYPNSVWKLKNTEEVLSVETSGTEPSHISGHSIKVPAASPSNSKKPYYVGIALESAFTNEYKGILGNAIKLHTDNLIRKHPDAMPALFIVGENWDPDAWEYIANKYNLEYITDDNWEEYVKVAEDEDDDEQVASIIQELP